MATHEKDNEPAVSRMTPMQVLWLVLAVVVLMGGLTAMFLAYD